MKEFDQIFKDMDKVFNDANKVFKDMDKVITNINNVYRKQTLSPWKPWFAWRPVKIRGKRVWLKNVYRRCINTYVDYDNWKRYEYGDMFDVLKDAGK